MILRQDFQFVSGTIGDQKLTGRLRGTHITLMTADREYTGQVSGDRIEGTVIAAGKRTSGTAILRH